MKKLGKFTVVRSISLVLSIGIFSGCGMVEHKIDHIRGNGDLITSEKSFSSFDKIDISGSAEVRFHESQEEYRTVVTVDSNLLDHTRIETRGDTLYIGTKYVNHSFTRYSVDVYCPRVTGVSVSGSGCFESIDAIKVSEFSTSVSGSGRIDGTVECDTLTADISGSGKITVSGSSNSSHIDISGSGSFNGSGLSVNRAVVRISGSGKANIDVSNHLSARISGSGEIHYRGNPAIDSKITGSGKIKKM